MTKKCGYVAVVGRPNVGKSTLINHVLGHKLNITSKKPQTTRFNLLGIKTEEDCQSIYVDTPGMHVSQKKAINRIMNRTAESVVMDVDVVVMVVDRFVWTEEDEHVLKKLEFVECPVILAINKIDRVERKEELLPHMETLLAKYPFDSVVPISALRKISMDDIEEKIKSHLPEGDFFYDEDQLTDKSERFLAAEIVREKIMRQLGDELPYAIAVEIEKFNEKENLIEIHALILVEREGQKAILIGKQGERLKKVGMDARKDMENLLQKKVMLKTWVKVKRGWSDDDRALKSLGYLDE